MSYTEQQRDEFFKNIEKTYRKDGIEHCWLWHGKHTAQGYGIFKTDISNSAHQFSYRIHKGDIPSGKVIDHLCEITSCTNPDHLEAVTQTENIRRILSRSNTLQLLYDITNTEHDIILNALPISPRLQQCADFLERDVSDIGRIVFPDYFGKDLGRKTIIDMLRVFLMNFRLILSDGDSEELFSGYKRKWFSVEVSRQIEWYGDISFLEVLEYYKPDLMCTDLGKYNANLDKKIDDLLDELDYRNLTSTYHLKMQIKDSIDNTNNLLSKYREMYNVN